MDVTHFNEFGGLKYIHVSFDTFNGCIFASLHAGEASKMLLQMFSNVSVLWDLQK